jgi:hypothetical protein
MAKKFDGIVEAVRSKNGQIESVRVFERRGAAFSDRIILNRQEFLDRLKKKKKYFVGSRKEFLAGTFEIQDKPIQIVSREGKELISTRPDAAHDELEQAPLF